MPHISSPLVPRKKMSSSQVNGINGDAQHSAFFDHLLAYPMIHDSVSTFKSNPYGQRSIALGDSAYQTFAKPMFPYLAKPYQYVSPYVKRADGLGDATLNMVDERFPVVKKSTGELYKDARALVLLPVSVGVAGKNHLFDIYNSETKKIGGGTLVTYSKALLSTTLILTTEAVITVSQYLGAKKDNVKEVVNEKSNN